MRGWRGAEPLLGLGKAQASLNAFSTSKTWKTVRAVCRWKLQTSSRCMLKVSQPHPRAACHPSLPITGSAAVSEQVGKAVRTSATCEDADVSLGRRSATSIGTDAPAGTPLVSVDSFADAICATGACRLTPQTRQGAPRPLHPRKGHRPLTLFAIELSPFPFSLPRVWLFP